MLCGGHVGRAHGKRLDDLKSMSSFTPAYIALHKSEFPAVQSVKWCCVGKKHTFAGKRNKPVCGCIGLGFIQNAKQNHYCALVQAGTSPDKYRDTMLTLGKYHSRDIHKWEGGSWYFHPIVKCSCKECLWWKWVLPRHEVPRSAISLYSPLEMWISCIGLWGSVLKGPKKQMRWLTQKWERGILTCQNPHLLCSRNSGPRIRTFTKNITRPLQTWVFYKPTCLGVTRKKDPNTAGSWSCTPEWDFQYWVEYKKWLVYYITWQLCLTKPWMAWVKTFIQRIHFSTNKKWKKIHSVQLRLRTETLIYFSYLKKVIYARWRSYMYWCV